MPTPAEALAQLQAAADRLGCNRGALARTFFVQGLAQLEAGAALVVLDHRCPGQAMAALPIKVPAAVAAQLQAQVDRLVRSRTALARTLLLQGLAQLAGGRQHPGGLAEGLIACLADLLKPPCF